MNDELKTRIESYFAELGAPLEELPSARREAFLLEARGHLSAMVEAKRADGLDEEAAWTNAMSEFGQPSEVGRALWKEWAGSGQLESEGEPLSRKDLARKYLPRLGVVLSLFVAFRFLPTRFWGELYLWPLLVLWTFGSIGWGALRYRRSGRKWTASYVAAYAIVVLIF